MPEMVCLKRGNIFITLSASDTEPVNQCQHGLTTDGLRIAMIVSKKVGH